MATLTIALIVWPAMVPPAAANHCASETAMPVAPDLDDVDAEGLVEGAVECVEEWANGAPFGDPTVGAPGQYCDRVEPYAGEGEPATLWTPLMVLNSPYGGDAVLTEGTTETVTISTGFFFGVEGFGVHVGLDESQTKGQEAAIQVSEGVSGAYYQLLTWTRVHRCAHDPWGPFYPTVQDYWYVTDYEPTGFQYGTTADLSGASFQTDSDNLVVPAWTDDRAQWQAMAVNHRYREGGERKCTDPGVPDEITVSSSELYTYEIAFTTPHGEHRASSTSTTTSTSYKYNLPGGHCWMVFHPSGAGKTAAFDYLGPSNAPKVDAVEWVDPDPVGCDVLAIVEEYTGTPYDWAPYTVHMKSHGSDYGQVIATPQGSIPFGSLTRSGFADARIEAGTSNPHVRAWKGDEAGGGPAINIDGTVTFSVDYEYDADLTGAVIPLAYVPKTSDGPVETVVFFHGIPEGDDLRVRLLPGTTLPDRFQETDVRITPALLAAHDGDLVDTLADLVLADPEDSLASRVTCASDVIDPSKPPPHGPWLRQHQSWLSEASLSTSGIRVATEYSGTNVEVRLVV